MKFIRVQELASTNEYMHQLISEGSVEEGSVVVAGYQTAGKGQGENSWESEQGKNLLFSMVLRPDFLAIENQFAISEVVSLGIKNVLSTYLKDGVMIKWPNDVYWKNKKIAGILIENLISGETINYSIIGIGINVNQDAFPENLSNAVSMKQITGTEYALDELLQRLQLGIFKKYVELIENGFDEIHHKYIHALYRRDGFHSYRAGEETFTAKIIRVSKSGLLELQDKEGKEYVFGFKEVEFV